MVRPLTTASTTIAPGPDSANADPVFWTGAAGPSGPADNVL
ncbi:MAG: hypothetical protein NTX09_09745 [Verrucomicrobia bacterium]|nr:hypothetical protein [Verrucomicrobiota bacterium]